MNPASAHNPYEAPEASLATVVDPDRLPPVFVAISLFCRVIGLLGVAVGGFGVYVMGSAIRHQGWRILERQASREIILALALDVLATAAYLVAGRAIRDRRENRGLAACVLAMGLTFALLWPLFA